MRYPVDSTMLESRKRNTIQGGNMIHSRIFDDDCDAAEDAYIALKHAYEKARHAALFTNKPQLAVVIRVVQLTLDVLMDAMEEEA